MLLEDPVVIIIMVEVESIETICEVSSQKLVVGLVLELQPSAVVNIVEDLWWCASTQVTDRCGHLLVLDLVVLGLLILALETLPRQFSLEEIDEHEAHALEVVTP